MEEMNREALLLSCIEGTWKDICTQVQYLHPAANCDRQLTEATLAQVTFTSGHTNYSRITSRGALLWKASIHFIQGSIKRTGKEF